MWLEKKEAQICKFMAGDDLKETFILEMLSLQRLLNIQMKMLKRKLYM